MKDVTVFYGQVIDQEEDRVEFVVCLNPEEAILKNRVLEARWFDIHPLQGLMKIEDGETVKITTIVETGKVTLLFEPVDKESHKHYFDKPDYFSDFGDTNWLNSPDEVK